MTDSQKESIRSAMEAYELYLLTKVKIFNSFHYSSVKAIRESLGMSTLVCRDCEESVNYFKEIYEIWNISK